MDWKDIMHYGGAAGLVFLGALGAMGLHIPGVTIDPATCFAAGGGIFAAGLKGPAKAVFLLPMLLLFSQVASAADFVPVKAPPKQPVCTVTTCTGLFVGGFVANAGGNLDVIGTGLTGLAQNGLGFGGQGGYEFFANNIYAAFYVDIQDDMNLNAPPGTSFSSRLTYGVGGRLGYSLASSFGAATTGTTAPTLPQQFLASLMTPYINVWEGKRHGQLALRSGAGIEALLSTNVTLNADYFHYSYNQGGTAGTLAGLPVKLTDDNEFRLSVNRHFGF